MKNLLRSKKLRVTDFRLAVLTIFEQHKNAISTEQIENELGEFDRITLYRTIKTFIEKGIIHEITMPGNIKKLALCHDNCNAKEHQHQHIHFRCNSCAEIFCLDIDDYPEINLKGYQIDAVEIQAKGICKNCA
ncbi:Fur family transcriptional regulator [Crocinitomix algicola]|uniref:Fur family transcriptional regulator n=1 Tax=Crocinitomix algicola TaxID=1740263 RepID=UPI000872256B|nr:transcriptional repressor [Crocinitomix algicola]